MGRFRIIYAIELLCFNGLAGEMYDFLHGLAYFHAGHAELDSASRIDTFEGEFWIPDQVRYDY